jgi:Protein of unknown function (DUF2442)
MKQEPRERPRPRQQARQTAAHWANAQEPAALVGIEPLHWPFSMSDLVRVVNVEYLGDRTLRITFSDCLVRELDFANRLHGVLGTFDNEIAFAAVMVDSIAGTVCWPNGIDLDPDVLHGDQPPASATAPRLLREYRAKVAV